MDSIIRDLSIAKQQRYLINLYRIDDEIFYTGYVDYLDEHEVVLHTYDYLGMSDGMSLLKISSVSEVELESEDLKMMTERIALANDLSLVSVASQHLMRLTQPHHWIKEVIGRSYVDHQAVMLILFNDDLTFQNIEGLVHHVGHDNFTFQVLNKNHFDRRKILKYRYDEIGVIEFLGKDLAQITRNQKLLLSMPHIEPPVASDESKIDQILLRSLRDHQLVEIESNLTNRYFYVGTVKAFNKQQYVLKLVDMNGQFGGYSILKRNSIKKIWIQSDYLTFMQQCVQKNIDHQLYRQPVLNDEREFDPETNMMLELLQQDLRMQRFIRLQLVDEPKTLVGMVVAIDHQQIEFQCFDDFVFQLLPSIKITLDQVGEVAFDYLDVFLLQRQYIDKKA